MTPREPSEEAVVAALKSWFGCDVQDLPGIKRAYAADMRRALRAAYAVDATEGRDG